MKSDFCGLIEVALCKRLDAHLTQKLGWFELPNQCQLSTLIISKWPFRTFLATLCLVCSGESVEYSIFFAFLNLFVTRRSRSSLE
jgi:hypothetical protein